MKMLNWINITFMAIIFSFTFIVAPLYIYFYKISASIIYLTIALYFLQGFSMTIGYHRLFSHKAFHAHPLLEFALLFIGAGVFAESALKWASQHRDHHAFTDDKDKDPYAISKGFWYAHIGWLFYKRECQLNNVPDLKQNNRVMRQHNNYLAWALISGLFIPLFVGYLFGDIIGAFIFAVCVRIFFVQQCMFIVNSVRHKYGKRNYDKRSSARDNFFGALLSNGEGYHNYHHRFPTDYRNGVSWYHWDPSKWVISIFSIFGLTGKLRRASNKNIILAKLETRKNA